MLFNFLYIGFINLVLCASYNQNSLNGPGKNPLLYYSNGKSNTKINSYVDLAKGCPEYGPLLPHNQVLLVLICEQTFSNMECVNSVYRANSSADHLQFLIAVLKICTAAQQHYECGERIPLFSLLFRICTKAHGWFDS